MSTRQLHSVANRNKAMRKVAGGGRAHVNLCDGTQYTSLDIGARATVVPIRDFSITVPHRLLNPDYDLGKINDPENILGSVFEGMIPLVTNNDPSSLMAAFNKRCNFVQEDASDDVGNKEFKEAIALLNSLRKWAKAQFTPWEENEVDRARWLKKFDPAKRQRMEQAWHGIPEARKKDIRDKTIMVKIEPLLKRYDAEWGPRAVYVGSDLHNCITGPAMMVAMERLCALVDTDNHGTTIGGGHIRFGYKRRDTDLVDFLTRDPKLNGNCIEGDYSRNDREQRSRMALIVDKMLDILSFPPWLRSLMLWSSEEYQVYLAAAGLKATLKHQLPTGTTATTFRNSTINMVMFVVSMHRQGVRTFRALILGDDLLAVVDRGINLKEWQADVALFKMVLKAIAPLLEGEATFLSRRLFTLCQVPCMMPRLGKALARFNVRATKDESCSDAQYMAGKSLSYAYEFRHVPFCSNHFMQRFRHHWAELSDSERAEQMLPEQSWFTRIAGLDSTDKIIKAIQNEKVLVSDDYFLDWCVDTYGLGLCDVEELLTQFVSQGMGYRVVDSPHFAALASDF